MIPAAFRPVLFALDKSHGPIYLVGGAIRDTFLGASKKSRPVADFDLILRERAGAAAGAFCQKTNARLIVLDEERKIFRAITSAQGAKLHFDFANFQGVNLEEDLKRRDFTVNAMALPIELCWDKPKAKDLIDPTGGAKDLKRRRLRCPAPENLVQDPIRLLRAFRFAAELNFVIEPKTMSWIGQYRTKISRSAPERIRQELYRLLMTNRAGAAFRLMDQTRLLTQLFGPLERSRDLALEYYRAGGVLGHALEAASCFEQIVTEIRRRLPLIAKPLEEYIRRSISGGFQRYATLKLSALLHDIAKPHTAKHIDGRLRFFGHEKKGAALFAKIADRLRLSREEIQLGAKIIASHLRPGNLAKQLPVSDRAVYRFFRDLGEDGVGVLLVALSDHQSYMKKSRRWNRREPSIKTVCYLLDHYYRQKTTAAPPKLISGHDVMKALKIPPCPQVGQFLDQIQMFQAEGKITTKAKAMVALAKIKPAKIAG